MDHESLLPATARRSIAVYWGSRPRLRIASRLLYRRQRQHKPKVTQAPRLRTTLFSLLLEMSGDQKLREAPCPSRLVAGEAGRYLHARGLVRFWDDVISGSVRSASLVGAEIDRCTTIGTPVSAVILPPVAGSLRYKRCRISHSARRLCLAHKELWQAIL